MIRLFEPNACTIKETITLNERANHHLLNVLRAKINDEITLFNGKGGEFHGTITQINKKKANVLLNSFANCDIESPLNIHLVQAIPKGDKLDYIVQKAVELGVRSITPVIAERSQGRLSQLQENKKHTRLEGIVISACEQSGRNTLPQLNEMTSLKEWLTNHNSKDGYILLPSNSKNEDVNISSKDIYLLVGPEGGFTPSEIKLAISQQIKPLTLGKRVLRTETASLAAIAIMQWQFGDLR